MWNARHQASEALEGKIDWRPVMHRQPAPIGGGGAPYGLPVIQLEGNKNERSGQRKEKERSGQTLRFLSKEVTDPFFFSERSDRSLFGEG